MLKYRHEIDGLRAIAVLSVILFHAGFETFVGGYIGVDVFFVISGYLITSIISSEIDQKKFRLSNFYERRARRILPALFFVMMLCAPVAWLTLFPKDLKSFFHSMASVPLMSANIFFWMDIDYFATAAELKPLLHTWSLSVEEQFYIIFPLLLMFFLPRGRKITITIITLISILSLARAHLISNSDVSQNFFLLITRFWEISIGALIALLSLENIKLPKLFHDGLGILGVLIVLVSVVLFKKDTPFPSLYALIPIFGTALIIIFSSPETISGKILGNRFLVQIGLISYSAYLWHQPIFAFTRTVADPSSLNAGVMLALSFISLLFAYVTWKFVELPFKNKAKFSRTFIFTFSIFGSFLFVVIGIFLGNLFDKIRLEAIAAKDLTENSVIYANGIHEDRSFARHMIEMFPHSPDTAIFGSSRIMQIRSPGAEKYLGLGVSGAELEDITALIHIFNKRFHSNTIMIGADPWIFNANNRDFRWKVFQREYDEAVGKIADSSKEISPVYKKNLLEKTIESFYKGSTLSLKLPEDDRHEFRSKKRNDGSHVYDLAYISKSPKEIEQGFRDIISYKMRSFVFSDKAKMKFELLLQKQMKINNVILVLSPYHPKLYKKLAAEKPIFLEIEKIYRSLAEKNHVRIVGSYDSDLIGCSEEEFYDGMHPKESCMRKVLGFKN